MVAGDARLPPSSTSMSVRRLGSYDEEIAEEACRLFGATGALDPRPLLTSAAAHLFVAEQNGSVVGWAYGHELVHPDGERTMLLYALDVLETARSQGHGRGLVEAFVEHARSLGDTEAWVLTDDGNAAAKATYIAAGGKRDATDQVMFTWFLAPGRHSG